MLDALAFANPAQNPRRSDLARVREAAIGAAMAEPETDDLRPSWVRAAAQQGRIIQPRDGTDWSGAPETDPAKRRVVTTHRYRKWEAGLKGLDV